MGLVERARAKATVTAWRTLPGMRVSGVVGERGRGGPEFRDKSRYQQTWVSRLRAKLEPDGGSPGLTTTLTGIGYWLEAPPSE